MILWYSGTAPGAGHRERFWTDTSGALAQRATLRACEESGRKDGDRLAKDSPVQSVPNGRHPRQEGHRPRGWGWHGGPFPNPLPPWPPCREGGFGAGGAPPARPGASGWGGGVDPNIHGSKSSPPRADHFDYTFVGGGDFFGPKLVLWRQHLFLHKKQRARHGSPFHPCPPPPTKEHCAIARVHGWQAVQSAERNLARQWPIRPEVPFCHKSETRRCPWAVH